MTTPSEQTLRAEGAYLIWLGAEEDTPRKREMWVAAQGYPKVFAAFVTIDRILTALADAQPPKPAIGPRKGDGPQHDAWCKAATAANVLSRALDRATAEHVAYDAIRAALPCLHDAIDWLADAQPEVERFTSEDVELIRDQAAATALNTDPTVNRGSTPEDRAILARRVCALTRIADRMEALCRGRAPSGREPHE